MQNSENDKMALPRHYSKSCGTINKPPVHEAYTVAFVEFSLYEYL